MYELRPARPSPPYRDHSETFPLKRLTVILLAFILSGCGALPNIWGSSLPPVPSPTIYVTPSETPTITPTSAATLTPSPTASITPTFTPSLTFTPSFTPTPSRADIKHALIISYDGLRPDAIEQAPMPNLMQLMREGAYNPLNDRTIDYPATSPSHASMLSGFCMEDTGVIYDKYFAYMGYSKGTDIFDLAHAAGMRTVMIVGKDKLRQMAEPETTDHFQVAYGEPAIAKAAVAQIAKGFGLMFIHFAGPDLRGHKYEWMSGEYMKVLRQGDDALGQILQALKDNGLYDSTFILVTSDHGGHGQSHIGTTIEDYRIAWVAHGPGVLPQVLDLQMYTFDTAPTVAYALGLPIQPDWDGIPVYKIFGEQQIRIHEKYPCKT